MTKENEIFIFDRVKVLGGVFPLTLCPGPNIFELLWQDVIKVKGFQVTPAELEGCLLGHPDVLDAAIIGVPHDYSLF